MWEKFYGQFLFSNIYCLPKLERTQGINLNGTSGWGILSGKKDIFALILEPTLVLVPSSLLGS